MDSFKVKTPGNEFNVEYFCSFVRKGDVKTDSSGFNELCKSGCKNYGRKYSCPPFSPSFESLSSGHGGLFVLIFRCNLSQIKSTEYNKLRIANVVMKSRIDKLMRVLEQRFGTKFLSTGSCRLCKPCRAKLNQPCRHPDKRRYSLEAVGIDCNHLSQALFKIPLQWFRNKKSPEYTCVLCGLLSDEKDAQKIEEKIQKILL